ncbi:MAG: chorismate mutase [Kiritimatiellaeota bacterium]|nr:chorismate mutase [Kiritimatiellota bacterium]
MGTTDGPDPATKGKIVTRAIAEYRKRLDEITDRLVDLLNERACIVREVGKIREATKRVIYRPSREAEILEQAEKRNTYLPRDTLRQLMRDIISACRTTEGVVRASYLGPKGTFSEVAALKQFGESATLIEGSNHLDTFRKLLANEADYAVMPFSNSAAGPVLGSLHVLREELFSKTTGLKIVAECYVDVRVMLLGLPNQTPQVIYAHEEALEQCAGYLGGHHSGARLEKTSNAAAAAKRAAETPHSACIAGERVLRENPTLTIVDRDIQDNKESVTRFVVIGKGMDSPSGNDKTCFAFCLKDKPGALSHVLDVLEKRGINLGTLILVPHRDQSWRDVFFVEIHGHIADPNIRLAQNEMAKVSHQMKLLGSYADASKLFG